MTFAYLEIKNEILDKINKGVYKAESKLPAERKLTEEYGVSRMTIRQAIQELVNEGYVRKEAGRGAYISAHQFSQLNLKSFTETIRSQGYTPSTKVLEFSIVHNLKQISNEMDMPLTTKFYKIKRLRLGDTIVIALETTYIPVEYCEGLREKNVEDSLYTILKDSYGYALNRASYSIEACIANRGMMENFKLSKPKALLRVTGITYADNEKKLFYEESYYHSTLYKYNVDIFNRGAALIK